MDHYYEAYGGPGDAPICRDMAFARRINRICSRWSRSEAQTMAEYAVVLGVITPAIVIAFGLFAAEIEVAYQRVIGFLS